jgi:hypothetical protein
VTEGGPTVDLRAWYDRYIEVFNAGDRAAFAAHFHPPVTVVHATRYDERRAGRPLPVLSEAGDLWAPLPPQWARTTVDSVTTLGEVVPFVPGDLTPRDEPREGILSTVTRWDRDGRAYQRLQTLYLLTREGGRLGIKVLVELAVADLADVSRRAPGR